MAEIIKHRAGKRDRITWMVRFGAPDTTQWELVRTVTSYPVTKSGNVQWSRAQSSQETVIPIDQSEAPTLIAELAASLGYAAGGGLDD